MFFNKFILTILTFYIITYKLKKNNIKMLFFIKKTTKNPVFLQTGLLSRIVYTILFPILGVGVTIIYQIAIILITVLILL